MNTRLLTGAAAAALLVASAAIGIASASGRDAADRQAAAADAVAARTAIARHDTAAATMAAEHAVGLAPRDAGYRLLLGQSYLAAGRFASARAAYADALSLASGSGKAALNLALTEIATGDWGTARRTLDEHQATIAPADRGLALALAGDPRGGVELLTAVARAPGADAKVRQNLALALALAGDWAQAKTVAAVDLSPADLDARIEYWAGFARPHAASDQVAALLGVTAAADPGQPTRLALAGEPVAVAVAAPASPVATAQAPQTITQAIASAEAPGFVAGPAVQFGPRAEVVQPLPATADVPLVRAHGPAKVALGASQGSPRMAKGGWFVQLGAYASQTKAREAWGRATLRLPALSNAGPSAATFALAKASVYRLSVGGFDRAGAVSLCQRYRASGGDCFVRTSAGDQVAAWARKGAQVAAR